MVSYAAHSVYQQIMLIFTFDADLDKAALLLSVKAIIQIKLGSSLSTVKHPLPVFVYHCFKPFNNLVSCKPP